ncbi:MAG: histidine kinase [Oscillospiraceae bacterium]|nr:histidine kinase [Oscillospiraceae bacterium]
MIGYNITIAVFCLVISLIILLSLVLTGHSKERKTRVFIGMVIVNIILQISSIMFFLLNGTLATNSPVPLLITECIKASCGPAMLILYTRMILVVLKEKTFVSKRIETAALIAIALCIADVLIILAEPFMSFTSIVDENNQLIRGEWFIFGYILTFLCMAINSSILFIKRKFLKKIELLTLMAYIIIPALGVIIHSFVEGTPVNIISITVAIVFYFAIIQNELSKQTHELEKELDDSRISVMMSQIQPHFIYNSLIAIREMCLVSPETASKAVDEFSNYLRGNLDSLSIRTPISFERELKHVKTYLSLEKRRFEDRLNIVYDLEAKDFLIPAMTLQLIVENAVRHGITKREDGGTVTIKSEEKKDDYIITVTDDGVGFDVQKLADEELHVGIKNARNRLAVMCGGMLIIESKPDSGTNVIITIPKE